MGQKFLKVKSGINFGSLSEAPLDASEGDIYYDSTLKGHRVYTGGAWTKPGVFLEGSTTPSSASVGDIYFDEATSTLKVYTPKGWQPLVEDEYDCGSFVGKDIEIDLSKSRVQKAFLDISISTLRFIGGTTNESYRIRLILSYMTSPNCKLNFASNILFNKNASQDLSLEAGGHVILTVTPLGNGNYACQIQSFSAFTDFLDADQITDPRTQSWLENPYGSTHFVRVGENIYLFYALKLAAYIYESFLWNVYGSPNLQHTWPESPFPIKAGKVSMGPSFVQIIEKSTGYLWASGKNNRGQLGINSLGGSSNSITQVFGQRSWSDVVCGFSHTVAIEGSTGLAWAWGDGQSTKGKLGFGTANIENVRTPRVCAGGRSYVQITAGELNSYFIEGSTGYVYTTGANAQNQLGTGVNYNTLWTMSSPVSVLGGRSYRYIAAIGEGVAAIEASSGEIYTWGVIASYAVPGSGVSASPINIYQGKSWSELVAGDACFFATEGSTGWIYYWGSSSYWDISQLLLPITSSPTLLIARSGAKIVGSCENGFYIKNPTTGKIQCSGFASVKKYHYSTRYPQPLLPESPLTKKFSLPGPGFAAAPFAYLENSTGFVHQDSLLFGSASAVQSARSFRDLTLGTSHAVAIEGSTGYAWAWGLNDGDTNLYGELGLGYTNGSTISPQIVLGLRSFSKICANEFGSWAVEGSTGAVYRWGQDGTGTRSSSPVIILSGISFSSITAQKAIWAGIEGSTGVIWATGTNTLGQLGNGTTVYGSSPTSVLGGRSYKEVAVNSSDRVMAAIEASTGYIWAWGDGSLGGLGNGTVQNATSPVSVLGGRSYSKLVAFESGFIAVEGSTGKTYSWGKCSLLLEYGEQQSSPTLVYPSKSFYNIGNFVGYPYSLTKSIIQDAATGDYFFWGTVTQPVYLESTLKWRLPQK